MEGELAGRGALAHQYTVPRHAAQRITDAVSIQSANHLSNGPCGLQVVTQVSLVGLLFGTLCGDFALLSDVGTRTVHRLWVGQPPGMPLQGPAC